MERVGDVDDPLVVYCSSGVRSLFAAHSLRSVGYSNVMSLEGGLSAWKALSLPTVHPRTLSKDERKRYSRQISLPEIGEMGQQSLKDGRVLVIGAGGLGSSCLMYLASAGVGLLGIVDHDIVDICNLQRQPLFSMLDLGQSKALCAKNTLQQINADIEVNAFPEKLTSENSEAIFRNFDIVIDCTDNFNVRYLINDTAVVCGIPLIHGSVFQFEGQAALFNHKNGACYRCAFAEEPPKEIAPSCSEAGVLGVVPGLIGLLQANIALKYLLGLPLEASTALVYQALDDHMFHRKFVKRQGCICNPTHREDVLCVPVLP